MLWIDVAPGKVGVWPLVLDAEGVPYRLARRPDGWSLVVAAGDVERSLRALKAYEQENPAPPDEAQTPSYDTTFTGVAVSAMLVAFFLVTGPSAAHSAWFEQGTAVAALIQDGQLWRTVTALTLHANAPHIAANAASGALFVTAVFRLVGPGVGAWLVLLAGALGNLANAYVQGVGHRSVGASTAIFGAVGVLAGSALVRERRLGRLGGRAWTPVAAGVALLALLGTGEQTDVLAHGLGFVAGALVGAVAARAVPTPSRPAVQWILAGAALAAVASSWALALR